VSYSGNHIKLCGETTVNVNYHNASIVHTFLVVRSNSVNLLGRDLCSKLNIKLSVPTDNDSQINSVKYDVLNKFKDYLSDDFQSNVKQTVKLDVLPNSKPVFTRARPVPVRLRDPVKSKLYKLVDTGRLTKVFSSEWASGTVNILKRDNTVRICGDFSGTVNKFLDPVHSPLPSIDDVISQVGNATIFSKIDLANAFLQLPLDEESKKYTTINTSEGLFMFNYLPFGLCSSPGIFQSFMNKILNGIDNVIIYQDDVLILSPTVNDHNKTLFRVLTALRDAGIKVNNDKCSFFTTKVEYLGHVFDKDGVHPNPDKLRAILQAPAPTDLKQLQSFLGMCNFYNRFIPNYSHAMSPFYKLLRKGVKFQWDQEQQICFEKVKDIFANNKVLKLYNASYETLLETDSSGYGIAAVLLQRKNSNCNWYPVQFASRTLNDSEKNYSNIEREALSVIFGCTKFRKFLLGIPFVIHNDQQPLRKLFAHDSGVPFTCSSRLQRWSLRLSQYNYRFQYSKGSCNVNSDCLSRLPLPETTGIYEPYELVFTINELAKKTITCKEIEQHTNLDKNLVQLKQYIKHGWPIHLNNPDLKVFKSKSNNLSILYGCILYNDRVLIPESLRSLVLQQFHDDHPGICAMKSLTRSLIWYPGIDRDVEKLVKNCVKCQASQSKPPQNRNIEWPTPNRVWSRVHIDHFFFENNTCLIAVDALSKYIEVEIVKNTSVEETIEALRVIFSRNGLCDLIVSDNATSFIGQGFKDFLSANAIEHKTPPPASPSSNGQAERGVKVVKDLLNKSKSGGSFKTRLAKALMYYRTVPHSVTKVSPSVSLNNRKFVTRKDKVNPKFCNVPNPSTKPKTLPNFEVGHDVLALNLRDGPKWYTATIVQKLGINVFNVLIHNLNVIWKRHSNQLLSIPSRSDHGNNNANPVVTTNEDSELEPSVNCPPIILPSEPTVSHDSVVPLPTNLENANAEIPSVLRRSVRTRKPVVRYGFD